MKVRISLAAVVALVAALTLGPASSSSAVGDNAVVHWSGIAESAISAGATPTTLRPPASSTVLAGMVHAAMYDAVAALEGDLKPFATDVSAPPEASAEAAVAQAARDVLVARVPAQAAAVQTAYDAYMSAIPDGAAKNGGKAVGAAAAAGMLALRTGDGFDDVVAYVQPPVGAGVFEPIAPTTPVDVKLAKVRPFTLESPSAFRPDAPYALTSKQYADDVAELQRLGGATSTSRTASQTENARFHSAPTYVQFSRGLRQLIGERGLDLRDSARLLGYTWVAVADTMIACWEAKYHYLFWRPNHAIQRADSDGNPATSPDATWLPLITGNHPEYPSGHACFTGGVTKSLHEFFGTKRLALTLTSTVTGTSRTYEHLGQLVAEVEDARVWGGLHYRATMEETAKHFPRIARDVYKDHFRKNG
jgi:hypothetical protein